MSRLKVATVLAAVAGCLAGSAGSTAAGASCLPAPYCTPGAPHIRLKIVRTSLAKFDLGGKLKVRVTVDEAAKVTLSGRAKTPSGKTVSLGKKVTISIATKGTKTATLRLSAAAKSALFTVPRATVTVTAKGLDAFGNRTTKRVSATFQ